MRKTGPIEKRGEDGDGDWPLVGIAKGSNLFSMQRCRVALNDGCTGQQRPDSVS